MAVWISLKSSDDILYGLLETYQYMNKVDREVYYSWDLHFYVSKNGRKRGMINHKRQNPYIIQLTFEIGVQEFLDRAKIETVIPREIKGNNEEIISYLRRPKKD